METLEQVDDTTSQPEAPYGRQRPQLTTKQKAQYVLGAIAILALIFWAFIEEKIRTNTREVLQRAARDAVEPRHAAVAMARSRVDEMIGYQRRF